MKKIIFVLLLMFCSVQVEAGKINQIIFFGDSLSDNGNLYRHIFVIPKSPPYFRGRFSNGPTWAENVGYYYYSKDYISYENYASGGATAVLHAPTTKFIAPTILENEINQYLLDAALVDKSNVLYSIWIGGNDYMYEDGSDINIQTDRVIKKIVEGMNKLIQVGAKNFLLLNLPDLSKVPFVKANDSVERVQQLCFSHNKKLTDAIQNIKNENPAVKIAFVNAYELFNDVMVNPQKYNDKYGVSIKDTTTACWQGGFFLNGINTEINKNIRVSLANTHSKLDPNVVINLLLDSPSLRYTTMMGMAYQQGDLPCNNANEHLFWDEMHPTEVVHQVLAKIVEENLDKTFSSR